jgi:hypothetical protein
MGLGERIKEFTPVKRYLIYKRINTNPPVVIYDNDFIYKMGADEYLKMGFKERIELARGQAKGKKLIFEAIEKIRNSRTVAIFRYIIPNKLMTRYIEMIKN